MSFLADILASKRDEVRGLDGVSPDLAAAPAPRDFVSALRSPGGGLRVIAEIKRASPSEGPIRPDLDVLETAAAYQAGGAAAISVLTDARWFQGSFELLSAVRAQVEHKVELPAGVRIDYAGQFEREEATSKRLLLLGMLAILGIGFIVATTLQSVRRSIIVLVNLPLALAGGVVGVYLAGGVLSVATTIGFITLFGIATRNGILLATRSRDLELEGIERMRAVGQAAQERLAPILMTAVTAALGLLPLALALGQPGTEIQAPMALVILTGLATSTLLNMVVVPALLAHWGGETLRAEPATATS